MTRATKSLALIVALSAVNFGSGARAVTGGDRCSSFGVVVSGSRTVVLRRGDTLYACFRSSGRRSTLGQVATGGTAGTVVRRIRVAGNYVAFEQATVGQSLLSYSVVVIDARRGTRRHRPTGTPTSTRGPSGELLVGIGPTTDVAVTSSGAAAWIARPMSGSLLEVHYFRGSRERLLQRASTIDEGSLLLGPKTVSWIDRGQLRYSAIPATR